MYSCLVCGANKIKQTFSAREMMFGFREFFDYVQCVECQSLQIKQIPSPESMQKYYPDDYYSFSINEIYDGNKIKLWLQSKRDSYELGSNNPIGFIISLFKPLPMQYRMFRKIGIKKDAAILDVGCGGGSLLDFLAKNGFKTLRGIDPFNQSDIVTKNRVRIDRCDIFSVKDNFDVIMFNHSFEHVPDPALVLRKAKNLLRPSGICIVRIPTSSSLAWEKYGKDWVQLDPPRHFVVPSRLGMKIMGQKSGLYLSNTIDDSTSLQFWASEQYIKNISLVRNGVSKQIGDPGFELGNKILRTYTREANRLNSENRGDQAIFIFRNQS